MYLDSRLLASLLAFEMDDLWSCCVKVHSLLTAEPSAPSAGPQRSESASALDWAAGNVSSDALSDAERQGSIEERSNRAIKANKSVAST